MQAVVSEEKLSIVLPKEVFRRRMKVDETLRKRTARCLFGVPDPIEAQNFVAQVLESTLTDFEKTWNWNVAIGEPRSSTEEDEGVHIKLEKYSWEEVLDSDMMAKSNRHRFDAPIAPNTRPVTLLFAPSDECVADKEIISRQQDEKPDLKKIVSVRVSTPSENSKQGHPSSNQNSSSDASISRQESRLSPPPLKQRCITDYMRVKKPQHGKKGLR